LNHRVARSTIAKVLKEQGIKPSPDRPLSWATFVRSHAHLIAAADFFTTEVWTVRGLVRHFTLFVIDLATRHVHVAGTTANPTSAWMEQTARNLTDCEDGLLTGRRFLILDRDAIFSPGFKSIVGDSGVEILLTAYQAPNMNAYAERFVRSIKSECLDQMIFVGQESLVRAIAEYSAHYHEERSHQGIGNVLVSGAEPQSEGPVEVRERLGGLLKHYHRQAA
jgi:transposase InsO family protein